MENWKRVDGSVIEDFGAYCKKYLTEDGISLYVGADSHCEGSIVTYSNPIIFYKRDKGGHVIHRKLRVEMDKPAYRIFERLMVETNMVLETAMFLRDEVGVDVSLINIHLDFNNDSAHKSYPVCVASVGYLKAMGFGNVCTKPDAWASNSVGNVLCKM
jgi:predicted RNase H-related nuclease YkuK (DUF458 family)